MFICDKNSSLNYICEQFSSLLLIAVRHPYPILSINLLENARDRSFQRSLSFIDDVCVTQITKYRLNQKARERKKEEKQRSRHLSDLSEKRNRVRLFD